MKFTVSMLSIYTRALAREKKKILAKIYIKRILGGHVPGPAEITER